MPKHGHRLGACHGRKNRGSWGRQDTSNLDFPLAQNFKTVESFLGNDRLLQNLDPKIPASVLSSP
jgi:hypothetical protein